MQNNEKQMRPDRTNDELKPTSSNILTDVERCRCDNLIHIKFKHKLLFLTQSYTNFTVHVSLLSCGALMHSVMTLQTHCLLMSRVTVVDERLITQNSFSNQTSKVLKLKPNREDSAA